MQVSRLDEASAKPAGPAWAVAVDFAGLAVALMLFSWLALSHLHLPGLYQDEALDIAPALRLLLHAGAWPYSFLPNSLALPLMVSDHVGPTSTYLAIPFLWCFGLSPIAVRAYEFAVGLAALVMIFFWARRVLPAGAAWVSALLLAPMPSLWLACRNGLHVSFIVVPLAAGALVAFDRWYLGRRACWLYVGAFLLGVGVSSKILFLWFLVALGVAVLATRPRLLRELFPRQAVVSLAWFAAGCAPFLVFNALSRGLTLRTIVASLSETPYGVRNAAVLTNLRTQLGSFASLLGGDWLSWAGATPRNPIGVVLFLLAAACLLARLRRPGLRRLHFSLVAVAVILLASCFTITTLGPKHLVLLLPFPTVIVAGALAAAWADRARPGWLAALIALSALGIAQFAWDLRDDSQYLRWLSRTGGVGQFSSAHNQLAEYLLARGIARPLAGDWGFDSNLEVLTGERVRVDQIFDLREPAPFAFTRRRARETLPQPGSVYLFHAEQYAAAPGRFDAVRDEAQTLGLQLIQVASFTDGLGRPVVLVYEGRRL